MTGASRLVRDAVLAVARDPESAAPALATLGPVDLASAVRACANQGLGTACAVTLHRAAIPVPGWLEQHRFDMAVRRLSILNLLGRITPVLDETDIPWVVLKGPVVAAAMTRPELRESVDLDVLIPGRRVAELISALDALGIGRMNQNWAAYTKHGVAEFPIEIDGVMIDVHWHLIPFLRTRRQFAIDVDAMLERRRRTTFQGLEFPRLDPVDHLTHLCVHAGVSGANKACWLRDVGLAASSPDLDWDRLVERTRAGGTAAMVGRVLDRAAGAGLAEAPDRVTVGLGGSRAIRWQRARDAAPRSTDYEDRLFTGFPVSVSRDTFTSTMQATRVSVIEHLMTRLGRRPHWSTFDEHSELFWEPASAGQIEPYLELAARATFQ